MARKWLGSGLGDRAGGAFLLATLQGGFIESFQGPDTVNLVKYAGRSLGDF
jgi:hypothetical protein